MIGHENKSNESPLRKYVVMHVYQLENFSLVILSLFMEKQGQFRIYIW